MTYKQLKKQLEYHKHLHYEYEDLFKIACKELTFKNLNTEFFLSVLGEVEVLCENKVNYKIISKVIKNARERYLLDCMINNASQIGGK